MRAIGRVFHGEGRESLKFGRKEASQQDGEKRQKERVKW